MESASAKPDVIFNPNTVNRSIVGHFRLRTPLPSERRTEDLGVVQVFVQSLRALHFHCVKSERTAGRREESRDGNV